MARKNRFVTPETVRLELSDSDWIDIKARLTYGEQQTLANSGLTGTRFGGTMEVDFGRVPLIRIGMWVTDWSLIDENGKNVPVSQDAISALDPETAQEILAVLTTYQIERDADPNDVKPVTPSSKTKS